MTLEEYIEKRRNEGCAIENVYCNNLSYVFVTESDGWISIFLKEGLGYRAIIQAKDREHAMSYIAMIEPVPACCEIIC